MSSPIALITGASRGIGAATARLAARRGYAVVVNYRSNEAAARAVVSDIESAGGAAVALEADVSNEDEVVRLFEEIDRRFGTVTALVNNAGVVDRQGTIDEITAARLDRMFHTNVHSAFFCCREAVRRMSRSRGGAGGAIVNVSSAAARLGSPSEYIHYAASKAALDALTIGLAKEVAMQGIRVNAVRLGVFYTELHATGGEPGRVDRVRTTVPLQRGGQPEEAAAAILWLLADDASYVTGTLLDVAGGR